MFNTVGQPIANHSEHQDRVAHVLQSDVGDEAASLAETALATGCEPNLILPQSNPNCISVGEDEDLMTVGKPQLGQASSPQVPEDCVLQTSRSA